VVWNVNVTDIQEGAYKWAAWCNDSAGNGDWTDTNRTFSVDLTLPHITIDLPANTSYNSSEGRTLNYTVTETYISTCRYSLDGANATLLSGCANATLNASLLTEGQHNLTVYANDTAGNLNLSTVYFTIDLTSPAITIISPGADAWDDDGNVIFQFRPYENLSYLTNCTVFIYNTTNTSDWYNVSNQTAIVNNITNNISLPYILSNGSNQNGTFVWNVLCSDFVNRSRQTSNYTFYVGNRSDIIVYDITYTPAVSPSPGSNLTINVTVKNRGTANVVNDTLLRFCFSNTSNPCTNSINLTNATVLASSLTTGSSASSTFSVTLSRGSGTYYAYAYADYQTNETEQSESNNTMTKTISTNLNVTIMNITYNNGAPLPLPGGNTTITASVKYDNGTVATNLTLAKFALYDAWTSGGASETNRTSSLTQIDFSQNTSGIYIFNYTVSSKNTTTNKSEYGTHTIKLYANDTSTGYEGNSSSSSYTLAAPNLLVRFNPDADFPMEVSTSTSLAVEVANNGAAPLYNVYVKWNRTTLSGTTVSPSNLSCGYTNLTNGSGWVTCGSISVTSGTTTGTLTLTLITSYGNVGASDFYNGTIDDTTLAITIEDTSSNQSSSNQQSSTTCTTNASCNSNQYCLNSACVTLTCPSGYTASNHKCVLDTVSKINITEYASSIFIIQGQSNTSYIKVKNFGTTSYTVKMNTTFNISGVSISITPASYALGNGSTTTFTMKITVGNTTEIGEYRKTIRVYDSSNPALYDEKTVTLYINPTSETQVTINQTYIDYKALYDALLASFAQIKQELISFENMTKVNRTYAALEGMLSQIESYISTGDYIKAHELLADFNTTLTTFSEQIEDLKIEESSVMEKRGTETWNWTIIGAVVVAAILLLVYLLLPPKKQTGYHPEKGYTPRKPEEKKKHGGLFGGVFGKKEKQKSISEFKKVPEKKSDQKTDKKPEQQTSLQTYKEGYEKLKTVDYDHEKRKKQ
jgi:hypothetical protein